MTHKLTAERLAAIRQECAATMAYDSIPRIDPPDVLELLDEVDQVTAQRDTLADAITLIRELHHPDTLRLQTGKRYCAECADLWPCPTNRALPPAGKTHTSGHLTKEDRQP